ncbi:MAG: lysophospholipid acyltransferase family protein [Acidobacteriaceae bacterium]
MSTLSSTGPQKPLSFYDRWRTNILQIPLIGLATAVFGSLSLTTSLWDRSGRQQHAIARAWARTLLRISGSPVTVIGAEHLQNQAAAVYTVNHLSYMDTPVIFSHLPFQFRILARHDLWKIPFMGWHLKRSGQIPVDSSSLRSQVGSLNRGVAALKAGMPLVVFPEGGRTSDGHPKSFMSGPAWMAVRAQVPIIPMALVGTYELLPMHVYHLRPRPLLLVVGEPIATTGLTTKDVDSLTAQTYDAISAMYYRYAELTAEAQEPAAQTT